MMKANQYLKTLTAAAVLCLSALTLSSKVYRHIDCKSDNLVMTADSIDFRTDLTRLYGKLNGQPHTSQRVDSLTINVGGRQYAATDIDGVDFKRWFQWEDDGEIPVEIDFPTIKPGSTATIEVVSARGNCLWILTIE